MVYKNAAHTLPTMFFPRKILFLVAWTTPKIRNTCARLKKMAQLREWLRFLLYGLSSLFYFSIIKGSFLLSSRTNAVGKSSSGNGCGGILVPPQQENSILVLIGFVSILKCGFVTINPVVVSSDKTFNPPPSSSSNNLTYSCV